MMFWLSMLILSAQPAAPMDHHFAVPVFATDFGQATDVNYDRWPDNWTRRRGQGFPPYVRVQVSNDAADESGCLQMELDGGGAVAYSPPVEINPHFGYLFSGKIKTLGLTHNVAYFTISFLDPSRKHTETYTSTKLTGSTQWQELEIGPLTPVDPKTQLAVVGLHLVPTDRADLTGKAMFDDLCLARLPNMELQTNRPHNLFSTQGAKEIRCHVSGTDRANATIHFELLDVDDKTLLTAQRELTRSLPDAHSDLISPAVAAMADSEAAAPLAEPAGFSGVAVWHPHLPSNGYYRVRASLFDEGQLQLQQTISLAVHPPRSARSNGEFGWSIARDDYPLSDADLVQLLEIACVNWAKYPVWYSPEMDASEGERIAAMADRLNATGIEMVGVFDRPPLQYCERFGNKKDLTVAEAFLEPDMWQPALDPLMVRLSLKVQWWQLGDDQDTSFINYQGLVPKVDEIQTYLKKYGQRLRLGLPWRWLHEMPVAENPPWDFLAMTETPSFTQSELAQYAQRNGHWSSSANRANRWVTLWPLPQSKYDHQTRAHDLVLRMVQAKVSGMEAIFAGNPFDPSRGLLHPDATPNDLFLPWCTTCNLIGGTEYLGSLQLPNGSSNHLFARDGEAVMVVWNSKHVSESLYLGSRVVQIDPWGRETTLCGPGQTPGTRQELKVGPVPVFVTGLNLAVARWRLACSFDPDRLASIFGHEQTVQLQFHNTFAQGVGGTVAVNTPAVWNVEHQQTRFKLGAQDKLHQDLHILLQANASSGPQPVRIDYHILADQEFRFSVYRSIQVGLGDVLVEMDTWLNDEGKLIVEQHLMNQTTSPIDLNCYLFAPGRRRLRLQVLDVGPGRVTQTYALNNGRELMGKTIWLRLEELNGGRLHNYHVAVEP